MKYGVHLALMAVLSVSLWANVLVAAAAMNPVEFNFENFTNEEVVLGVTFKNKQGIKTRTVTLAPNKSGKEVFEGCLEEVKTQVPTDLVIKGIPVKTSFKPSSRFSCRTMLISVHKATNGSFEIGFAYQ